MKVDKTTQGNDTKKRRLLKSPGELNHLKMGKAVSSKRLLSTSGILTTTSLDSGKKKGLARLIGIQGLI